MPDTDLLQRIKDTVASTAPGATVILYGSYARGDQRPDSDIDLLILVDKDAEKLTLQEERTITYPLYDIEADTGIIVSPLVYTKLAWQNHWVTPFYENVNREGRTL